MISALDQQLLAALLQAARRANAALRTEDRIFQSSAQAVLDRALLDFELKSRLLLEIAA